MSAPVIRRSLLCLTALTALTFVHNHAEPLPGDFDLQLTQVCIVCTCLSHVLC